MVRGKEKKKSPLKYKYIFSLFFKTKFESSYLYTFALFTHHYVWAAVF